MDQTKNMDWRHLAVRHNDFFPDRICVLIRPLCLTSHEIHSSRLLSRLAENLKDIAQERRDECDLSYQKQF